MKKKFMIGMAVLCAGAMLAGCGNTKEDTSKDTAKDTIRAIDIDDLDNYVTLGEYKGLEAEKTIYEVTDEDIQTQIDSGLAANTVEVTDRAVQEGDILNIDYVGSMDGAEFEGGTAEAQTLEIGSNSLIEGFEAGLIGANIGDEVELNLTFPDPYENNPDFAGKPVVFLVTVNSISEAPELTNEWVAENTEYTTIDEYKASIKESLQESNESRSESDLQTALFTLVVDDSEIKEYPEDLLAEEVQNYKDQIESMYGSMYDMTLDELIETMGYTEEEFEKLAQEQGKSYLTQKMVVQAIFNAEDVKITQEDYDEMMNEFAVSYGYEDKKTLLEAYDESQVKNTILWRKACDILMETAVITEVPETTE